MTMTMIAAAASQKRSGRPFIIKVNYASGFTVTLPLYNAGGYNYNFIVDWGDGAVGQVTSATDTDRVHTYSFGGTYTIKMTGTLEGWLGNATGLKEYITEVTQWGNTGFKSVLMTNCSRLVNCYKKLITSQTSFSGLFQGCTSMVSCDVSEWDVSKVTSWGYAFANAGTFYGCTALTSLDTSAWTFSTISNITFETVFKNCTKLTTIGDTSGWDTSKFSSIQAAFTGCSSLSSIDVSGWRFPICTNFGQNANYGLFAGCKSLTSLDCSAWTFNTSANIYFSAVFYNCTNLTTIGDTSGWNTSKFYSMSQTFQSCSKLTSLNVSGWNVSNCISFDSTFINCASITSLDVSLWDTANVTNLSGTFENCTGLTSLDISSWDVSKVTSWGYAFANAGTFYGCTALTSLDTSAWTFSTISNITFETVFKNCTNITTIGDTSGWDTSKFISIQGAFKSCSKLSSIDVSGWRFPICTNFGQNENYGLFAGCTSLTSLDCSAWTFNTSNNITFTYGFVSCTNLTTVGDISGWNTSKLYNLAGLFQSCTSLTSLNMGNWNISGCINFENMFLGCTSLTSLTVTGWALNTTTNVNMAGMFTSCSALTTVLFTGWNTSKVTNFQQFLDGCTSLTTCDVSVLSTASATNVSYMFRNCRSMTSIDISGWDLSLVTAANMTQYMFTGCYGLVTLTLPASLSRVDNQFAVFGGTTRAITQYNINRATAPTVSGTPFGNYAKPLHVPVSNSGYNVAPWTNTAIFSSIINDL